MLLGYRDTEERLTVVRGRIRQAEQVRRRYGLPLPLEVRYDDYTVDIPENRLLLAAVLRLLRLPGVRSDVRSLLRHLLVRLDGVNRLTPGLPLPRWTRTRLNARYGNALGLAELILRGATYELDDGTAVRVDGYCCACGGCSRTSSPWPWPRHSARMAAASCRRTRRTTPRRRETGTALAGSRALRR